MQHSVQFYRERCVTWRKLCASKAWEDTATQSLNSGQDATSFQQRGLTCGCVLGDKAEEGNHGQATVLHLLLLVFLEGLLIAS